MHLPNFFIIGADKAGTTGLYETLKQHSGIFMSPVKEPHFFAFESQPPISPGPGGSFYHRTVIWRPADYAGLFANATDQRAIGEASAGYLRLPQTAARLHRNLPQAKLVAILRQPAERAYSNYTFARSWGEPEPTFEKALAREQERIQAGWFSGIYYKSNGYYAAMLARYSELFPPQQIKIFLYEEWRQRPQAVLRDLFQFLEVDVDVNLQVQKSNVTLLPRSRWLHELANQQFWRQQQATFLPLSVHKGIAALLLRIDNRFNLIPPPPLPAETRARLTSDYREDILKLETMIGRDLSHWLDGD